MITISLENKLIMDSAIRYHDRTYSSELDELEDAAVEIS
jgi:hypothetical protein